MTPDRDWPEPPGLGDDDDRNNDDFDPDEIPDTVDEAVKEKKKDSTASELVKMAIPAIDELYHDDQTAYADVNIGGHRQTLKLRTRAFRSWLTRQFRALHERVPNTSSLQDAITVLEGVALFDGVQRQVHVRVAEQDGVTYLDLGDETWTAVAVDANGWRLTATPPVRFRRPPGMLPLPRPESGGHLNDLRPFVNVADDGWVLVLSWVANLLRTIGPHAILMLVGEQGSAKSCSCRAVRRLVDPNKADLRAKPRDEHNLAITARNGWVLGYDNISAISEELADALCRLATGQGFGTRELYTDDEETIFEACRPQVVNGIGEISARSDLLDRSVIIECPLVPEKERVEEKELWERFDEAHPKLLGAVLDATVTAKSCRSGVSLPGKPRMADYARWAAAASLALGVEESVLVMALVANRNSVAGLALDASPVARRLVEFVAEVNRWEGTSTELLEQLEHRLNSARTPKGWPSSARAMGQALRRLAPDLRRQGVDVDDVRLHDAKGNRGHRLEWTGEGTPETPGTSGMPT